jgi:hypothetical protein
MNVGIVKYYPDIIFKKIELTDEMGIIYEQKLKDTYANKFKYFIYRLFSALVPGVLIPQWLKNTVEYKVKTEKKDGEFKKIDKKTGKKIYHQVDKLDNSKQERQERSMLIKLRKENPSIMWRI